jgi:alpha-1,2-mannosyltransferase
MYLWAAFNFALLTGVVSVAITKLWPSGSLAPNHPRRLAASSLIAGLAVNVLEPVHSNFSFGQINVLLIGLVVADVLLMKSPLRGVLVGVAGAVKFTPLVFLVLLVLDDDWPAALRGAGTFAALTAASWAALPADSARYFLHFRTEAQHIGPPAYVSNQSWTGILARLHVPAYASTALWIGLSMITLAAASLVARRLLEHGSARVEALLVMALAGLMMSPISWSHHWSWLILAPLVLASNRLERPVRLALAVLVGVAVVAPFWWPRRGVPLGPLAPVLSDSLALAAIGLLAVWTWHPTGTTDPEVETRAPPGSVQEAG